MGLCDEQPPFAIPSTELYHPEDPQMSAVRWA